jgi:hypothetical protein
MSIDSTTDLYRYFDAEGRLLYVGISFSAIARAAQHRKSKGWWRDVANMTIEHLPTRAAALDAERNAIIGEKPAHNIVWSSRPVPPVRRFRSYRVAGSCIVVVPGRVRRASWGGVELVIADCPGCGGKHTHGVLDVELQRGIAHRFPHCHDGPWGMAGYPLTPWQVVKFTRRDMGLDLSVEDENHQRGGPSRSWSHFTFRNWRAANERAAAA